MKKYLLSFCILLSSCFVSSAQLSQQATISVLTCRAGDDLYNMFGHTAVRVQDPVMNLDVVYNYGLFSFKEEGFMMKFLRGKLNYWVGRASYGAFIHNYKAEKRSVIEQVLDLDHKQVTQLYQALRQNIKPENKYYKYDFFFDNCTTRIRDMLEDNITLLNYSDTANEYTYRQLLDQFNYVSPWTDFGMDLLVGTPADATADAEGEMFLPEYLFQQLAKGSLGHTPLVKETQLLLDHESKVVSRSKTGIFGPSLFFGLLLLLELLLFRNQKVDSKWLRFYDKLFFTILGLGGLIIVFMWFATDHITTKNNLNLLWMNPLFLILLCRKTKPLLLVLSASMALSLLGASFIQQLHIASIIIILIALLKLLRHFNSDSHYLTNQV